MKMASTLLLAMLMLLGAWMGEAKLDCDYDRIRLMDYVDVSKMQGTVYLAYADRIPTILQGGEASYYVLDTTSFLDYVVLFRFDHIDEIGFCERKFGVKTLSENNTVWTTELFGLTEKAYFLATDYSTTAVLLEFLNDQGERDEDVSFLAILVTDPTQPPNMDVVKDALKYTCGPDAGDLSYYEKFAQNPNAICFLWALYR